MQDSTATAAAIYGTAADHGWGISAELQEALEDSFEHADNPGDRELFINALIAGLEAAR